MYISYCKYQWIAKCFPGCENCRDWEVNFVLFLCIYRYKTLTLLYGRFFSYKITCLGSGGKVPATLVFKTLFCSLRLLNQGFKQQCRQWPVKTACLVQCHQQTCHIMLKLKKKSLKILFFSNDAFRKEELISVMQLHRCWYMLNTSQHLKHRSKHIISC